MVSSSSTSTINGTPCGFLLIPALITAGGGLRDCCLSGRVRCQVLVVSCWEIAPSLLNHVVIWHSVVQKYTFAQCLFLSYPWKIRDICQIWALQPVCHAAFPGKIYFPLPHLFIYFYFFQHFFHPCILPSLFFFLQMNEIEYRKRPSQNGWTSIWLR